MSRFWKIRDLFSGAAAGEIRLHRLCWSMAKRLTGGCACGAVRYEMTAKPIRVHCCHCSNCQRQTGSAFVVNAVIEASLLRKVRGRPTATPVPRVHAPHDVYRCRKCKVAVWSDYGRRPGLRFVRVGTLDDPGALKPDIHIYTRAKASWVKIPEGTPSFREYYDVKKVWPKASLKRLAAALKKK
jgi:hypothetical protein